MDGELTQTYVAVPDVLFEIKVSPGTPFPPPPPRWYNVCMSRSTLVAWILLGLTLTAIFAAVAVPARNHFEAEQAQAGSKDFAETKAVDEVVRRTGLPRARFTVVGSERDGASWWVLIHGSPPAPGNHCSVVVSDDGNILAVRGGK